MKHLIYLFSISFLIGCKSHAEVNPKQINWYWEIEFVQQKNETFKSKQSKLLYDYYFMENNKGIYKKVVPQLDGSFQTSKSEITFEIIRENGTLLLQFTSPWSVWYKTIKHVDDQRLVLSNQDRTFNYKRPPNNKIILGDE